MITHASDIKTTYSQPSNLIPHFWNYKIIDKEGSPDLPCIMILSELFGWFRSLAQSKTYYSTGTSLPELVEDKLAVSYEFLSEKLNFNKERIRRNLVKLESLGILSRDIKNIALENGSRIKQLYISIDQVFFKSCFRNPELDIRVGNSDYSHNNSSDFKRTPLLGGEHISKKNNIRSIISNDKGFEDKETLIANKPLLQQKQSKNLNDFYPISKEDGILLQSLSGRDFGITAMNEILKDMSKRLSDKMFYSKKGFISYMSKAFRYELRDAVKTNNETFKIKANYSEEENNIYKEEKFLSEIESCLQVTPEWHLKKKLAAVLDRSQAYKILSKYKRSEREGAIFKIHLSEKVEIGEMDKQIILNQVKATQERVGKIGDIEFIEKIEILFDKKERSNMSERKCYSTKLLEIKEREEIEKLPIWLQMRRSFIKSNINEQEGVGIDRNWLSKIEASEERDKKRIVIKTKSGFNRDWIKANYLHKLERISQELGYKLYMDYEY